VRIILFVIFILGFICNCAANVIYVDVDGPNVPGTGSLDDPFRKIQNAISVTVDGDIVEVGEGIYTGEGNYNIDPCGVAITIRSTKPEDSNIVAKTVIDTGGFGRGFYIHSGEDANCVISGFTIQNGYTAGSGGGIYCNNASPSISHCVIRNNMAVWGGGGIYYSGGDMVLRNCVIAGNTTDTSGGGVNISASSLEIINCTFSGNFANWYGDGVYSYNSEAVITNSIIWENGDEQIYSEVNSPVVNYCDIQGGWGDGVGNIDQQPWFADFNEVGDANMWDFHLQSIYGRWNVNSQSWVTDANTSVCIDAGDPSCEWSSEFWPNGKRVNMGAYGASGEASMNGNEADFDIDGDVDFLDFADMASCWLMQSGCIEGLDGDSLENLGVFNENWLWIKP